MRELTFEEIALNSKATMVFKGGFLDEKASRRHLRNERQFVAFSVAWDAVLLSAADA